MIVKRNKNKVKEKFLKGQLTDIEIITPNIADRVLVNADKELNLEEIMEKSLDCKMHEDGMKASLFLYSLLSAKLKRLFSITESTVALTAVELVKKFEVNIASKKEVMSEGNMRLFLKKITTTEVVTQEEIEQEYQNNVLKNIKQKKEENKRTEDKNIIKQQLQIKKNGTVLVTFFNTVMSNLLPKITQRNEPTIHILDCVKIPVTVSNNNYELSTTINYEGKAMRGYKMGVLRKLTDFGGIIEYLINGTMSDNDMSLTKNKIIEYNGFQKDDYLIADRGFACLDFIKQLVEKGVNVIIPVKKNMDIFTETIRQAKKLKESDWQAHPNNKRKGQSIALIKDLKGTWLEAKEKTKKPEKALGTALDFSACVVRIEKDKNKDIVDSSNKAEDDTDIMYEDDKYIYIVITSTNTALTATEIIRYYELRPEIEEDFRQLKDIWKMCTFTSTKYIMIMCQIVMTMLAYNLFNIYKNTEAGSKYINKSMKRIANEEKRDRYPFEEISYLILCGKVYCIIDGIELLDLYADCSKDIREKLRPLFSQS